MLHTRTSNTIYHHSLEIPSLTPERGQKHEIPSLTPERFPEKMGFPLS
jgi:hypothetical protein